MNVHNYVISNLGLRWCFPYAASMENFSTPISFAAFVLPLWNIYLPPMFYAAYPILEHEFDI